MNRPNRFLSSRPLAFRSRPGGRRARRGGFALAAGALLAASPLPAADLVVQGTNSPYPFTTGTAAYTNIYVGQTADGTLNQSGGTLTATNFYLGYNAGVTGTCNLSAGTLNTAGTLVGESGTGVFNQTGGVFNDSGGVYLGYNGGSTGTLTLSGGTLTETNFFEVGYNGTGTLNVSAGTLDASADPYAFTVGFQAGSQGTVSLSGTGVLKTGRLIVGNGGNGVVTQSGSSVVTLSGLLAVGNDDGSGSAGLGTYNLQGGTLTTPTTYVGDSNNAAASVFNQTGGTHTISGALQFGYKNTNSAGTYNLSGGTLTANQVVQNAGTGTFNFNGGTLRAGAAGTTFMQGLSAANVQANGAILDTQGFAITVAQNLAHDPTTNALATDGGLTKLGTGTLTLTGTNTYTGPTVISTGTLLADNTAGSATGTGVVTVASGAILGGTGALAGAVTVQSGGRLDAGNAGAVNGLLSLTSSLNLNTGATLGVQLGGTAPGTGYDQIRVAGTLTLGGTLSVSEPSGFKLTLGQTFVLLDDTGTSLHTTTFANAPLGVYTDAAGNTFLVNYGAIADGDLVPNDVTITVQSVVPEPSTYALLTPGALGLGIALLRRRRSAALPLCRAEPPRPAPALTIHPNRTHPSTAMKISVTTLAAALLALAPGRAAADPAAVFVSNYNGANGYVSAYSATGAAATGYTATTGFSDAQGVAYNPASGILYLADFGNNQIRTFNAATGAETQIGFANAAGLGNPYGLALNAGVLYVANYGPQTVTAYNAATGATVAGGFTAPPSTSLSRPIGLAVNGTTLFVVNSGNSTLGAFNLATGAAVFTISGLTSPRGVALFGNDLFVANSGGANTVGEYDATTGAVINASFVTGLNAPVGLAVLGNRLLVANEGGNTVGAYGIPTTLGSGPTSSTPSFLTGLNGPDFVAVVPEPSAWALLATGTGALGLALRPRRAAARA